MKKTLLTIMLIASTMILLSCDDKEDTTVSNSTKNIEHTTRTRSSTTESEYTKIDYYENMEIDYIDDIYPFSNIVVKGSVNIPNIHTSSLLGVQMITEHDGETITLTLKLDDRYFSQEYMDEKKVVPISKEKKIQIDVNDLNQLVYKKEQYTDEIDVAATEAIMKYFEEEGTNVEVVKKYLYVYDGDGEYGEVVARDASQTYGKDSPYYHEETLRNYVIHNSCLRAICYSQDKGRYYPVRVAVMINDNELVDIEVYVDYMQTSFSVAEAYEQLELFADSENMELIEYTK
ncbi:MAG: hypothetical protein IJ265_07770 [Oscillospiraceae bacterium]|nr:hypothetical protein [Oscillospiraceae bacterium]